MLVVRGQWSVASRLQDQIFPATDNGQPTTDTAHRLLPTQALGLGFDFRVR